MAFYTEEEFSALAVGSNTSDLPPGALADCLQSAINRIRKLVGDAVITEVENASDNTTPQVADLREAQELLARRKLIQITAGKVREGGIVVRERDENGNTTNEYIAADKSELKRAALLRDAMELIEPYVLSTSTLGVRRMEYGYSPTTVISDW